MIPRLLDKYLRKVSPIYDYEDEDENSDKSEITAFLMLKGVKVNIESN